MNIKKISKTKLSKMFTSLYQWAAGMDRIMSHEAPNLAMEQLAGEVYSGKHDPAELVGAGRFFNYYKKFMTEQINTEYYLKLEKSFRDLKMINRWRLIEGNYYCPWEFPDEEKP